MLVAEDYLRFGRFVEGSVWDDDLDFVAAYREVYSAEPASSSAPSGWLTWLGISAESVLDEAMGADPEGDAYGLQGLNEISETEGDVAEPTMGGFCPSSVQQLGTSSQLGEVQGSGVQGSGVRMLVENIGITCMSAEIAGGEAYGADEGFGE